MGFESGRDFFGKAPQPQLEGAEIRDVALERSFRRNAFGLALGLDRPVVEPVREPKQPRALGPVTAPQLPLAGALQITDAAQAVVGEALLGDLPDPEDHVTGLGARKAAASVPPSTAKPRGLSRSEAILARNLLDESPIDTVMPSARSTSPAKPASALAGDIPCNRAVPDRSMNPSSIDTASTSRLSLNMSSRTSRPTRAYLSMFGRTTVACGHNRPASNIGIAYPTPNLPAT